MSSLAKRLGALILPPGSSSSDPADANSEGHAIRRRRALLHGLFSGSISRLIAIGVSFITVPLTLRFLGPERYGIWITLSTTVALLGVLDLGIANTLTTLISQAFAADDKHSARRYSASAFWMTVTFSILASSAGVIAWEHINWANLLHLSSPAITQEARLAALIVFLSFCINLPFSIIAKLLAGYQEVKTANYLNSIGSVIGLFAIIAVMHLNGGIPTLAAVYSGAITATNIGGALWLFLHHKRWLMPVPWAVSPSAVRALAGTGLAFFIIQLNGIVVFSSDNLVISHYLGPVDVTPYSIVWRLTGYAAILQTVLFPSLWPAYSEAYFRGDYAWVRRTFWAAARATMAIAIPAALGMLLLGRPFIRIWAGAAAVPSFLLLALMCVWTTMSAAMNLQACLMAAVHRIRLQAVLSVFAAVLNLVFSVYFARRIGSAGVILGTILAHVLVLVVPQTVIAHRILYRVPQPAEAIP